MIRIEELRIGNLVMETIYDYPPKEIVFGRDNFTQLEDYYTPIPLSEEILFRFGAIKGNGINQYNVFYFQNSEYVVGEYQGEFWLLSDKSILVVVKKLSTVHDFQNIIFSLTGEELKLK